MSEVECMYDVLEEGFLVEEKHVLLTNQIFEGTAITDLSS